MPSTPNSQVGRALQEHLESVLGPLRALHPVPGGGAQGAEVWHAVMASGRHVAAKRHRHAGAGEVEFGVLQMLFNLGAPVARPLDWDAQVRVLTTQWMEVPTLAAAMHTAQVSQTGQGQLSSLAHGLVRGCIALETAFTGLAERLPAPKEIEQQRRCAEVRERCRDASQTYLRIAKLCNHRVPPSWASALQSAWHVVADSLCEGQLTLGGRDCTPRNVLTDGRAVWFVDFAVVGLDWPEARLAQYAAAVNGNAGALPPASLLTHAEERWYVDSGRIESAQLDMHHLLLWSEVSRLLLDGRLASPAPEGDSLKQRLRQALKLALFPLAAGTPAEPVRSLLASAFANELIARH